MRMNRKPNQGKQFKVISDGYMMRQVARVFMMTKG